MQTMASAYLVAPHIIQVQCHACGKCLARQACRPRAILNEEPGETPFIDASRCYGCRACVAACPFNAVTA
jgi:MinD superfamily P-loop ATPase